MKQVISVVIATFNRLPLLRELVTALERQTHEDFEVVVVDDGSATSVPKTLAEQKFPLRVLRQENAGAASARDRGIHEAKGDIIVIVDDDMLPVPEFLAAHQRAHDEGATLVLGLIADDEGIGKKPLFERFHQKQLARLVEKFERDPHSVHGVHVCTGNVSFRRDDYLRAGGFDRALKRSEDRELGVRLEKNGAKLAFSKEAKVVHRSDHTENAVWLRRNFLYGVFDARIAHKHPDVPAANPWHFFSLVNPVSRPLLWSAIAAPSFGARFAKVVLLAARGVDRLGFERLAIAGATLCYGLDYYRGVREESGSLQRAAAEFFAFQKRTKNMR